MHAPITRQQLQGMVMEERTKDLLDIVGERTRESVLDRARKGDTSYTWFVSRACVERKMDELGWANSNVKIQDLLRITKMLYPDCDVTLADSPVGKTITIDWS